MILLLSDQLNMHNHTYIRQNNDDNKEIPICLVIIMTWIIKQEESKSINFVLCFKLFEQIFVILE